MAHPPIGISCTPGFQSCHGNVAQSRVGAVTRITGKEAYMRRSIYLLALAPLALVGCGSEPATVTTTTTTQEVTTTGPAREVVGARTPPAVRVETQTVAPAPGYIWTRGYWRWTRSEERRVGKECRDGGGPEE